MPRVCTAPGENVPDKWNCYPWDAAAYGERSQVLPPAVTLAALGARRARCPCARTRTRTQARTRGPYPSEIHAWCRGCAFTAFVPGCPAGRDINAHEELARQCAGEGARHYGTAYLGVGLAAGAIAMYAAMRMKTKM